MRGPFECLWWAARDNHGGDYSTAASELAQLGYGTPQIKSLRKKQRVSIGSDAPSTYNLNRYDKEKQAALESWERKLNSIITGEASGKVVSIQGRKKAA